jgi:hypothetical protein
MLAYFTSSLPLFAVVILVPILVFGGLILCALRTKGDVFAEMSHGKTTFRFDARDKRSRRRS